MPACRSSDDSLHIAQSLHNCDASASVSVLTRFDNPCILWSPILSFDLINGLFIIRVDFIIVVIGDHFMLLTIFLFLIVLLDGSLNLLLRIFYFLLKCVVVVLKLAELSVVDPMLGVESERQNLEWVLPKRLVVLAHVDKDAFFICQLLVLLQFFVKP